MLSHSFRPGEELTINEVPFVIANSVDDGEFLQLRSKGNGKLVNKTRDELLKGFNNGTVCFCDAVPGDPALHAKVRFAPPLDSLGEAGRRETLRRRKYLTKISDRGALDWGRSGRIEKAIKVVAKAIGDDHPPSRSTVHRWYREWVQRRRNVQAIASRIDRRGGGGRGRLPEPVEDEIRKVLDEIFLTENRGSAKDAWLELERQIKALNLQRSPDDPLPIPSLRSLQRRVNMLDAYEVVARREGRKAAKRRFRKVIGTLKVERILERVEMDHTPLNLFVIDDESLLPLGRPYLTVALDKKSRALLGYWMGFTGHGADAVLGCLNHAIRPKTYLKEKFPHIKLGWPCYGLPNMLALDNGMEFVGEDLTNACAGLGIDILYMPARKPEWKGSVERFLRTFNHALIHQIPGTTFESIAARGDYDPIKDAFITLTDLERLIETWICDVYHNEVHRGINARPIDVWNRGVEAEEPALPSDINRLEFELAESDERTLWHYGVEMFGQRYNNRDLAELFAVYGKIKANLRFHRADISRIWVEDPGTKEYFEVPNVDQEYSSGLSLEQHTFIQRRAKVDAKGRVDRDALLNAKAYIRTEIQRLMASTLRDRQRAARLEGKNIGKLRKKPGVLEKYAKSQDAAMKAAKAAQPKVTGQPSQPPASPASPAATKAPKRPPLKFASRDSGKAFPA